RTCPVTGVQTCTLPIFTSTKTVSGNGDYPSDSYTALVAGTYHWVASYSGDLNNESAGPTSCADPSESVTVTPASPKLTTTASQRDRKSVVEGNTGARGW